VLQLLTSKGLHIEERLLQVPTCDKMRSAIQFQVNKMGVTDLSTKDMIISSSPISD